MPELGGRSTACPVTGRPSRGRLDDGVADASVEVLVVEPLEAVRPPPAERPAAVWVVPPLGRGWPSERPVIHSRSPRVTACAPAPEPLAGCPLPLAVRPPPAWAVDPPAGAGAGLDAGGGAEAGAGAGAAAAPPPLWLPASRRSCAA